MSKSLLVHLFLLVSLHLQAQETSSDQFSPEKILDHYPVIEFEAHHGPSQEIDLAPSDLERLTSESREHLKKIAPDLNLADVELKDVTILLPKTNLFPPTIAAREADVSLRLLGGPVRDPSCLTQSHSSPLLDLAASTNQIIQHMERENLKNKRFNPGQIYFTWGYNRAWHSKSDATFKTSSGEFTIRDTVGRDRPSTALIDYIKPNHWLIPQYNLRFGYQLNPKWSLEVGMDHMKWVFDPNIQYQVEGHYDRTVFVLDPNDPHNLFGLNFDQVKESGNMSWLNFEHTDGYNYAFVSGLYRHNLSTSKNGKFSVDALGGAGLGPVIPKTKVIFHQDSWWNFEGLDNKFHVAGLGGHAEAKLRVGYGRIFAEAATRYTLIKINDALVNDQGDRLEQTPIGSIQVVGSIGFYLNQPKNKKKVSNSP